MSEIDWINHPNRMGTTIVTSSFHLVYTHTHTNTVRVHLNIVGTMCHYKSVQFERMRWCFHYEWFQLNTIKKRRRRRNIEDNLKIANDTLKHLDEEKKEIETIRRWTRGTTSENQQFIWLTHKHKPNWSSNQSIKATQPLNNDNNRNIEFKTN